MVTVFTDFSAEKSSGPVLFFFSQIAQLLQMISLTNVEN